MASQQWHNQRTTENLHREISWIINNRVNDPRIPSLVTISSINLAPDTRNATIFVSIFGDEKEQKSAIIALNRATPFIQKCCAEKVKIKNFPKLYFKLDTTFDKKEHLDDIFEQIKDDLDETN